MRLTRALTSFSHVVEIIGGVFLAIATLIVFVSALGRYVFAAPIPDSFDLSRLMLGVVVMWGFASIGFRGAHIQVDLLAELLPLRIRRWLDVFAWLLLWLFTLLLAWKMLGRVTSALSSNESTFDLRLPVWPMMAVTWLGVAASVFTVFARLLVLIDAPEDEAVRSRPTVSGDGL